jgi:hypothetical protein
MTTIVQPGYVVSEGPEAAAEIARWLEAKEREMVGLARRMREQADARWQAALAVTAAETDGETVH